MRLSAVLPVVVASVAIGCSQPVSPASPSSVLSADPDFAAGASDDGGAKTSMPTSVPFKGTLQGQGDPPVFEPPPSQYFTAHLRAEGQATHLGRFTMDFSHRVNLVSLTGIGQAVLTAANGDQLMTDVEGQATPAGSPTQFTSSRTTR
jgi:hypothetical protein